MEYTTNAALMFVTIEDTGVTPCTEYTVTEVYEEEGETLVTMMMVNGEDILEHISSYPANTNIRKQ